MFTNVRKREGLYLTVHLQKKVLQGKPLKIKRSLNKYAQSNVLRCGRVVKTFEAAEEQQ